MSAMTKAKGSVGTEGIIFKDGAVHEVTFFAHPVCKTYKNYDGSTSEIYVCPVCQKLGVGDKPLPTGSTNCPICGVAIRWEGRRIL